jgi:hypothetical protein
MKQRQPRRDNSKRRPYLRPGIEITSIDFVPMTEADRQKAIAALVQLFMPLIHGSKDE